MLRGKLIQNGNSKAVIVPKNVLSLLGWDEKQELELTTDGKSLKIAPIEKPKGSLLARLKQA